MLGFLLTGEWRPDQVTSAFVPDGRRKVPEVEAAIDSAWAHAITNRGIHLFDGPMCRLESWQVIGDQLHLQLSRSSYKPFFGTNMAHPEFFEQYGPEVMGNLVGVSPALVTGDGYFLMGRRNEKVAYYPNRVHPFAGALEPDDKTIFAALVRELNEELSLPGNSISDLCCSGCVQDFKLRQTEFIFSAKTSLTLAQIESGLDPTEHRAIWSTSATMDGIESALAQKVEITPVGIASLLLWGRLQFGGDWFGKICRRHQVG